MCVVAVRLSGVPDSIESQSMKPVSAVNVVVNRPAEKCDRPLRSDQPQ